MSAVWAGDPAAYLGSAVAGFPNAYLVHGPNIGLGHTSVLHMFESHAQCQRSSISQRSTRTFKLFPHPHVQVIPAPLRVGDPPTGLLVPLIASRPPRRGVAVDEEKFHVNDIVEFLVHWHAGRTKAGGGREPGSGPQHRPQVHGQGRGGGLVPGGPALSQAAWGALVRGWFPELVDPRARSLTHASIDAHRDGSRRCSRPTPPDRAPAPARRARPHRRASRASAAMCGGSSPTRPPPTWPPRQRPEVEPGEEAQIDYGYLGTVVRPAASRLRRVWAFVMVLAFSRHMFVRPVLTMDQRDLDRVPRRGASTSSAVRHDG